MYDDDDLQKYYNEEYFTGRDSGEKWKRRAEFIVEKFGPRTHLDIGCSYGTMTDFLNELGVDSYGIDGSDYAINNSRCKYKDKISKVNLNTDEFPHGRTYDLITGFYVVEHVHNFEFFTGQLKKALGPGGKAWFLTPDSGEEGRNDYDVFTNRYSKWVDVFAKHGMRVEKFNPYGMMALTGRLARYRLHRLPPPSGTSSRGSPMAMPTVES